MNQNDQAAMNEQFTQLRLQGLSIDGDNRYKQDLIDAIIGAMMFGAQGANPPPAGHWLEQFYVIAREERDALARVEAERDALRDNLERSEKLRDCSEQFAINMRLQRDAAQAQLAEAVELLRLIQTCDASITDSQAELIDSSIDDFLARYAQAEQQEAQGAQAVDERATFEAVCRKTAIERGGECSPEALRQRPDGTYISPLTQCGWWGWQARAALATQPAVLIDTERARRIVDQYDAASAAPDIALMNYGGCAIEMLREAVRGAEHE